MSRPAKLNAALKEEKEPNMATLPIHAFRGEILAAVKKSPATIIVAETGAGKSTQVPQYLLEAGYRVIVTQPRRLAASSLAARVAEERGCRLGDEVGFRTARDREVSEKTSLTFLTDGLQLVRELVGHGAGGQTVLVLDEVHEWNLNVEVLVAWARRQVRAGVDFKVVLMSATLEAEKLSAFFDGAPVINVPGRTFPVEERNAGRTAAEDVAALVREGRNVLAFQPGKAEINAFIAELNRLQVDAEIIPLHGELERREQQRAFAHYGRPKVVVGTNVMQTSITIDDADAVVDSGVEKRTEVVGGVEGLYLRAISRADSKQRKGRAGRCKAGIYIDHCPASVRPDFPTAEILRVRLDQTVLRLAMAGFDMEELEFFHQPDKSEIRRAKESLKALGCLNEEGAVTPLGRNVSRLPVSPNIAVMLLSADGSRNPQGPVSLVEEVLTIAAILEVGGIVRGEKKYEAPLKWRSLTGGEQESDLIAQLNVSRNAPTIRPKAGQSKWDAFRDYGILGKQLDEVKKLRAQLSDALRGKVNFQARGTREDLLRIVCAGMVDHLFKNEGGGYLNGDATYREIGKESVVRSAPSWVVGLPFDLEGKTDRGRIFRLHLVRLVSKVDPAWLCEVAPHLARTEMGVDPKFDSGRDTVVSTTRTLFRDRVVKEETVPDPEHPEAARIFAEWLASTDPRYTGQKVDERLKAVLIENRATRDEADRLNSRAGEKLFPSDLAAHYLAKLAGVKRQADVVNPRTLVLTLDAEVAAWVRKENPEEIEINGQSYPVTYGGSAPSISIEFENRVKVLSLPDEIALPGGRKVTVVCPLSWWDNYGSVHTDIPALKTQIRDSVSQSAFDSWEKPELPTPDLSGDEAVIPEIGEMGYGEGLFTAYHAVVGERSPSWDSSAGPTFSSRWFRTREEAEVARENSVQLLDAELNRRKRLAEEARAAKEREAKEAEALKLFASDPEAQRLVPAFSGNYAALKEFIEKVKALPMAKLDEHILGNCGRARVKAHLDLAPKNWTLLY
jgi:HrpA-like RNA helicase